MAKGYWIVRVDVNDPEIYKAYLAADAEPLRKYTGRIFWCAAANARRWKARTGPAMW
jgi:uncharacterized protein (DUF1330 family)